ncbi:MAG: hypothetical protein V4760_19730, partial [Bdellovibrionota bacterium]
RIPSGLNAGSFGFAIRVPVKDERGKPRYVLSVIKTTESTQELLSRYAKAPNEWTRGLIDDRGILAARSREPEK